mgnify:CR=1 FL=1|jgi:cryptic phage CTXphi transcriptional repressor rstR
MKDKIYQFSKNFAKNLKEERLLHHMTQQKLAEQIGIKTQSYQAYESGLSMPTVENLLKISLILNISIDDLFEIH